MVKWAHAILFVRWAERVKKGTKNAQGQTERKGSGGTTGYLTYMVNPAVYLKEDIVQMRKLCEQPPAANSGRRLCEGTKEEWKVTAGMVEGSIVALAS